MSTELKELCLAKANEWLSSNYDEETRNQVKSLIENDEKELIESFYTSLEFGTGGLRGIMGVGTNRMNKYTVSMAAQGFANYLINAFPNSQKSIAVAHDCRNNSDFFALTTAKVFLANGFKVFLFDALRPTPELSFAVRHFGCVGGVVITASHNPKEYNGFKAYWNDGGQLVAPHDKNVIDCVNKVTVNSIKTTDDTSSITVLGKDFDDLYVNEILKQSLSPQSIKNNHNLKIVYSALHGTGVRLVPYTLNKMGFTNILTVPEQNINDGNFPTVHSPNPEERAALNMALELADKENADLVMATDPDADRVGIAVRNENNQLELLNGNQTAALLSYYILTRWKETGKFKGNEFVVKTIVTTELISDIAKSFGVEVFNVLTGFKFIADIILKYEGQKTFVCGGEESYGFLVGDYARDKDAVNACCLIAECAAWAKDKNMSLYQLLIDIYKQYGYYKESLLSLTKKGKDGIEEIKAMMSNYRNNPPTLIANSKVVAIFDYQKSEMTNCNSGEKQQIDLPKSDVLQFVCEDESIISVRPSGTEPKIKFYFGVKQSFPVGTSFRDAMNGLDAKIEDIKLSLNI